MRVGDVCTLVFGQSPSSDSYNADGDGLPFYQGNADFGKEHPKAKVWCNAPKKTARAGDILLSVRAPIGAVNTAEEVCCIGRGVAAVRPNPSKVNAVYLKQQLLARRALLESKGTGSTFKAVGKKVLTEFPVILYSLSEQEALARKLQTIQDNLRVADQKLFRLDLLVKSRFVEMFGDPASNPKRFPAKPGSELFRLGNGKTKPVSQRFNNGVPAYGGNGITWYTDEAMTSGPTIVLGRVGRHCGNARLVIEPCWVTDNAMYIKNFYDSSLDFIYLINLMSIVKFNRYADEGDLWKITQRPFMEFEFPLPPLALQQKFSAFVQRVDKLRFVVIEFHECRCSPID